MHPAISVIFFTVTSGAGLGLAFLLALGFPVEGGSGAVFIACGLAGGLTVAGLVSSLFHLGHPERAWRALSQWRSSWLSREGILAIATMGLFAVFTLIWLISGTRLAIFGLPVAALCLATVFATAMIYGQLKTVPAWSTPLTPACYLLFSLSSGLTGALIFAGNASLAGVDAGLLAIILLVAAWAAKLMWWRNAERGFSATGTDAGTATGLGSIGNVRLLERPHSGENYLTREMVHRVARRHATKLRVIAVILGLLLPVMLVALASAVEHGALAMTFRAGAFVFLLAGLFVERWLFFAQARHAVSFYYGD